MIDVKQAIQQAKAAAAELLENAPWNVEEIERVTYKDREIWSITLSLPKKANGPLAAFSGDQLQYKIFWIDADTGELVAIKIRDLASR